MFSYAIFQFLGKKWIETKFQERLQEARHEHAKELERLKAEINALLNRLTRLQDKEFEVITELWSKINDSIGKLSRFVSVFQSYPDLEKMSDLRREEFLEGSQLLESEREEIRNSSDKNSRYQELLFGYELHDVRNTYSEFHVYFLKNRIFLNQALAEPLTTIDNQMWDVLQKRSIGKQIDDFEKWVEASRQMREDIEPSLHLLESNIQEALNRDVD